MLGEIIALIGAVGALLLALYGFMKFVISKFESMHNKFIDYIERKDAHSERQSNDFTDAVRDLSENVNQMNKNDDRILSALESNSIALGRAVKVLELHEKKGIIEEGRKFNESATALNESQK